MRMMTKTGSLVSDKGESVRIVDSKPDNVVRTHGFVIAFDTNIVYEIGTVLNEKNEGISVAWMASGDMQALLRDTIRLAHRFNGCVRDVETFGCLTIEFTSLHYATSFVRSHGLPEQFRLNTDVSGWGGLTKSVEVIYRPGLLK